MRWDRLFADLEAEAAGALDQELAAEVAERSRAEYAAVLLADRLRGARGHPVTVTVQGAPQRTGTVQRVGVDWLLMGAPGESEVLVRLDRVLAVSGLALPTAAARQAGPVQRAMDFRRALRALAVDRSSVTVSLVDGSLLAGTIDRVGADHVELAEHAAGEPRRAGAVRSVRAVATSAIGTVSRRAG